MIHSADPAFMFMQITAVISFRNNGAVMVLCCRVDYFVSMSKTLHETDV